MEDAKLSIESPEGSEKRRHQRVSLEVAVKYKVINRKLLREIVDQRPFLDDGKTINISLSGVSLITSVALTKGDFLKLEMGLPDSEKVTRALAEVMWSGPDAASGRFSAGIRFLIILNEADEHSVKRFIMAHGGRG
jgi:c-di-GMP-binding flagellar brake protein YcgR